MLFRDFKTGLAIGLTALLFSSGAVAGTLGAAPPGEDDDSTLANERVSLDRFIPTTIATEIFGGTSSAAGRVTLTTKEDSVFFQFNRPLRDPLVIDLEVGGAEVVDDEVSAYAYQVGVAAISRVTYDTTGATSVAKRVRAGTEITLADGETTFTANDEVILYGEDNLPLTMSDFFDSRGNAVAAASRPAAIRTVDAMGTVSSANVDVSYDDLEDITTGGQDNYILINANTDLKPTLARVYGTSATAANLLFLISFCCLMISTSIPSMFLIARSILSLTGGLCSTDIHGINVCHDPNMPVACAVHAHY